MFVLLISKYERRLKKDKKENNRNCSKGSLVLTEGCPFMKVGDQFCISSSSSNEEVWLPLDNLEIQAAYAMVYPLSQNKIKDYNVLKCYLFLSFHVVLIS